VATEAHGRVSPGETGASRSRPSQSRPAQATSRIALSMPRRKDFAKNTEEYRKLMQAEKPRRNPLSAHQTTWSVFD
jgi:hypothetical protein